MIHLVSLRELSDKSIQEVSGKGDLSVSPPVYNPLGPHPPSGGLQLAVDSSEMLADKSQ